MQTEPDSGYSSAESDDFDGQVESSDKIVQCDLGVAKIVSDTVYIDCEKIHTGDVASFESDGNVNCVDNETLFQNDWEALPQRVQGNVGRSTVNIGDVWECDDSFWSGDVYAVNGHVDITASAHVCEMVTSTTSTTCLDANVELQDEGIDIELVTSANTDENPLKCESNFITLSANTNENPLQCESNCITSTTSAYKDAQCSLVDCDRKFLRHFDNTHIVNCNLCTDTISSRCMVEDVINLHDNIVASGVPNAVGCRLPVVSGLNIDEWRKATEGFYDTDVVEFLEFGWPIGMTGRPPDRIHVSNHKGATEYPLEVASYVTKGVNKGQIIGPFRQPPFSGGNITSPLNSVPKKDTSDRRIILDLSFPRGSSVNDSIPKDSFLGVPLKLHLPSVDKLVSQVRALGLGCLLYKRDLKAAYRQLPVDPRDIGFLQYCVKGHFFCDVVYPMGLRSACQGCQRTTNAVAFAFQKRGFKLVNYIDDLAGAEVPDRASAAFDELGELLGCLGLAESVDKACSPSTVMIFLGIEFNTVEGTLEIPPEKLREIRSLLLQWSTKREATKLEVQSLVGSLNFLAACVRPGRIFMSRLLNFLRSMSDTGSVVLDSGFLRDVRWWHTFAPVYNGISLMPLADWSKPDGVVSCDACLQGCGGWSNGRYFHSSFPQFILDLDLHINALELLTLVVALKLWGQSFAGLRIKLFCDNEFSVTVINSGKTRDEFSQACIREICWLCANFECEVRAVHLPGVQNRLPDLLSRWELSPKHQAAFFESVNIDSIFETKVTDKVFMFSHVW